LGFEIFCLLESIELLLRIPDCFFSLFAIATQLCTTAHPAAVFAALLAAIAILTGMLFGTWLGFVGDIDFSLEPWQGYIWHDGSLALHLPDLYAAGITGMPVQHHLWIDVLINLGLGIGGPGRQGNNGIAEKRFEYGRKLIAQNRVGIVAGGNPVVIGHHGFSSLG